MKGSILVAEDDRNLRRILRAMLTREGYEVSEAVDGAAAASFLAGRKVDALVTDIRMPGMDGMELFRHCRDRHVGLPVILVTAYGRIEDAVEAMRAGAFDYILKPFDEAELLRVVGNAVASCGASEREGASAPADEWFGMVGRSPAWMEVRKVIGKAASSPFSVLITGETGTGKELVARAIHGLSQRRDGPFVAVNCGALPDTLLESELFGYKAGAFTDAKRDKPGRFALADGGTIFLDEIGDISPAMQVRLLRVLQERVVEPLGGIEPMKVNVRIVAATNKNLSELVKSGSFREDLYYRIRVIHLQLPTLRQRREDIPLLVDHLVGRFNRLQGKDVAGVSNEVMARLMDHEFPGNVRELENIIEQAFVLCSGGLIELSHLPSELRPLASLGINEDEGMTLSAMEKHLIALALQRYGGNRKKAAGHLGIDTSTLFRKIRAYNINVPESDGRSTKR
ncbi:MAG TPA: hypothetical protein DCR97_04240 [Deltaproteobacteria bacterium]|nr:hypothetical protein [Deltaproteobacteria bacterium]